MKKELSDEDRLVIDEIVKTLGKSNWSLLCIEPGNPEYNAFTHVNDPDAFTQILMVMRDMIMLALGHIDSGSHNGRSGQCGNC